LALMAAGLVSALSASSALAAPPEEGARSPTILDFPERWDLGLWTLMVFLILLFVLSRWAWKPMLEGLHKREETIRSAVEEARKAREDATRLRDQLQREVDRAHEKVRDILDEARRDAQHTTDQMVAKARDEIKTERDRLRREIEIARDQALQELWNSSAQLATLISAKAIRRQLALEDHRRLLDEALAELREAGSRRQREVVQAAGGEV
jgi:F-type H+-transporting ATPase subunit b